MRLDGESHALLGTDRMTRNHHSFSHVLSSAEVIAQMIAAELAGMQWTQPEWLPTRYLTWEERGPMIRN